LGDYGWHHKIYFYARLFDVNFKAMDFLKCSRGTPLEENTNCVTRGTALGTSSLSGRNRQRIIRFFIEPLKLWLCMRIPHQPKGCLPCPVTSTIISTIRRSQSDRQPRRSCARHAHLAEVDRLSCRTEAGVLHGLKALAPHLLRLLIGSWWAEISSLAGLDLKHWSSASQRFEILIAGKTSKRTIAFATASTVCSLCPSALASVCEVFSFNARSRSQSVYGNRREALARLNRQGAKPLMAAAYPFGINL
jgi:hypothetical protein